MTVSLRLSEIIARLGGELLADENIVIRGVASLSSAQPMHASFFSDTKYQAQLDQCNAGVVIIDEVSRSLTTLPRIVVKHPQAYFAKLTAMMYPPKQLTSGFAANAFIHPQAQVDPSCVVCEGAYVGAGATLKAGVVVGVGVVIADDVCVGEKTIFESNASVYHDCIIGADCIICAGAVIGADGFGYVREALEWVKVPQIGRVVIEDNVVVGANTTIDRGALDDTIIQRGVKLDNQIQIGHNCVIGQDTVIAGCVGIAGSARIGANCRIGGAAMILGHLEIADGVTISPGSMITRSLTKADTYTALMPFQPHNEWLKTAADLRHLHDLKEKVHELEKQVKLLAQRGGE